LEPRRAQGHRAQPERQTAAARGVRPGHRPGQRYFVNKYGLNPEALATVWTGDNPASVIGLGLIKPGQVAISLGTSDTFFGTMQKCQTDENGEGHVFGSPAGGYMTLICFKNGSLAREKIRELYGIPDWKEFGELVARPARQQRRNFAAVV
jgi:sugar (pentulose or hexulose) kinase